MQNVQKEVTVPYEKLIPAATQSGGRTIGEPSAGLSDRGLLMLKGGLSDLLGNPQKVSVEADIEKQRIRLTPTTPDDAGAFTLSSSQSPRIYLKALTSRAPEMIGEYSVLKQAHCVVLNKINK